MKTKIWLLLIGALLVLCAVLSIILMQPSEAAFAEIYSDGKLLYTLDLQKDQTLTVESKWGENVITVRDGNTVYRLAVSGIIYLEVRNHSVHIFMDGSSLEVRGQMNQFEEQLRPYGFLRPHASYLVNMDYIQMIHQNSIDMKNAAQVPLSQHRKKEFMAAMSEYLGDRI